jgi:hypothetical protein
VTTAANTRRALCEKLWADGVTTDEIIRQMGWNRNGKHPPASYIARYRQLGWNLPPREPERAASIKRGRWPEKP